MQLQTTAMAAISIYGVKYIESDTLEYQEKECSLNDKIYVILRDIFANVNTEIMTERIQKTIKRHMGFAAFNVEKLDENELKYLREVYGMLNSINETHFDFYEYDVTSEKIELDQYIKYEDWCIKLNELIETLGNLLVKNG